MARRIVKAHPYPGIGAKIREARLAAGLTAAALGELVGGSNKQLISQWEREVNCPSEAKMALIERALGIELPRAVRNASGRRSDGERACLTCGKMFAGFYRKKYCSHACWYATMPPKRHECPACGNGFEPGTPNQVYCSPQCKGKALRLPRTNTHCKACGCEISPFAPVRQQYCSRLCARRARSKDGVVYEDGDRRQNLDGYVMVKVKGRWLAEHRVVAERLLGRRLLPGENVHHKDRDRANNDPGNLEMWVTPQPAGRRVSDLVEHVIDSLAIKGMPEEWRVATRSELRAALCLSDDEAGLHAGPEGMESWTDDFLEPMLMTPELEGLPRHWREAVRAAYRRFAGPVDGSGNPLPGHPDFIAGKNDPRIN